MIIKTQNRGIALLITLLLTSVLLGVSTSLLNITLKQYLFANIGIASETAFHAANSGMECILFNDFVGYHDTPPTSPFDVAGDGTGVDPESSISCMGDTSADLNNSGNGSVFSAEIEEEDGDSNTVPGQRFQFDWGGTTSNVPPMCSVVTVYKFSEEGTEDGDAVGPDMAFALGASNAIRCAEDTVCTIIRSRGYNASCADVANNTGRILERELIQRY